MPRDMVILGPPGTGKTSACIRLARNWFKTGVAGSGEVAYLAFTKAAAKEAADRILDEDLKKDVGDKLPYFRTLHSLAYRGLREDKEKTRLVTTSDMKHFAQCTGFDGIYAVHEWEDLSEAYQGLENKGRTDWDKCLSAYTLSRISARDLPELQAASKKMCRAASLLSGFLEDETYSVFVEKYEAYKKANGLVDFCDMLVFALTEMPPMDKIKYVIIDEAQDLAPILHRIVEKLFRNAVEIWWAGDDDQCQPAGTKVRMSDGTLKDISTIIEGDRVRSFVAGRGELVEQRILRTASRLYSGDIFSVHAGSSITRATADHRFVVANIKKAGDESAVTVFQVHAADLDPGTMLIPVEEGSRVRWVHFQVTSENATNLPVFSLKVDKSETYVADGIVTHNCIYTFAAADAKLFIDRANRAHTRVFLRDTQRFGKEIVDISSKIISQVRHRVPKEVIGMNGRNHVISSVGEFKPIVGKMMLLHRHVMGCQALAATYFAAGMPFRNERGRDPLGYSQRVKAYQALRDLADGKEVTMGAVHRLVDDLMPSMIINEKTDKKIRLVVHGGKKKLEESGGGAANIMDLMRAKILTEDGADLIRGKHFQHLKHSDDLEYYDRVIDNGYSLDTEDNNGKTIVPIITTIHGSKGRESGRVVVFSEMGNKCGMDDMDGEHRLAYVAATRTFGELEICQERLVDWAEKSYEYPVPQNGNSGKNRH